MMVSIQLVLFTLSFAAPPPTVFVRDGKSAGNEFAKVYSRKYGRLVIEILLGKIIDRMKKLHVYYIAIARTLRKPKRP